jgi:hypothetical protein
LVFTKQQKKTKRKTTREVKSNQMTEKEKQQIENLEEQTNILFKIGNKLEQRIATLEKVLQSHAKCIGQLREEKNDR